MGSFGQWSAVALAWLRRACAGVVACVFPHVCVGCGAWDELLCPACRAVVCPAPDELEPWRLVDVGGQSSDVECGERELPRELDHKSDHRGKQAESLVLPHWSVGEYVGILRFVLLAAKHRPDVKLEGVLLDAGYSLGRKMGASQVMRAPVEAARDVWVIPAPSRFRRRFSGRDVALPLAVGVARGFSEVSGLRVSVVEACALKWGAGSQSGRSGRARRLGRAGSMRLCCEIPPQVELIVVDDIVTTGATVGEMVRVMGVEPLGVASLCAVP